jgi:hypothetical protein
MRGTARSLHCPAQRHDADAVSALAALDRWQALEYAQARLLLVQLSGKATSGSDAMSIGLW